MTEAAQEHKPVLFGEVLESLDIRPDGIYLDGTFGRGGHAGAILARLNEKGRVLAMDRDPQAIEVAHDRFGSDSRFTIVHDSFELLARAVDDRGWRGKVDGILLDLGVSSPQLDDATRGFSFLRDGPLDMRMDTTRGVSARDWLASAGIDEISRVFKEYGEERYAKRIAAAIVKKIENSGPVETTLQLAKVIADAHPRWPRDKHPATRCFQAIRIHVNGELEALERTLPELVELLAPGGRLTVISFHSLEDRIVKRFMRDEAKGPQLPPDLPVTESQIKRRLRLVGKAIRAGKVELAENPRSRSAVLRVAERLG